MKRLFFIPLFLISPSTFSSEFPANPISVKFCCKTDSDPAKYQSQTLTTNQIPLNIGYTYPYATCGISGTKYNYTTLTANPIGSSLPCQSARIAFTLTPDAYSCPTNSTLSSNVCQPNAGYNSLNNDGVWTVVPELNINSNCGVLQDYKPSTSTCGYTDSFLNSLSLAVTGLGVVVGSIGAVLSAPLVAGVGAGIALLGGVSSISINGNDSDSESLANGSQPLNVRLSPSAPASLPSIPSVVYDTTENKFKPDSSGATGSWSQNGATGEWETTPDSKGSVSKIASNGQSVTTETPVSGGGKVVQTVTKKDNQFEVARTVPQTISYADGSTAQGTVTSAQSFNSSGTATSSKSSYVMPKTSTSGSTPVSSSSPSTYTPPPPSTGGTNIVAGQCGSMNCESTQLAIHQALTKPADMSDMQPSDTESTVNKSSVKGLMFSDSPQGIQDFFTFQLPPHNSTCPILEIPFNGETKVMNTHCTMAETQRDNLTILFNLMWTFVAFMILIGA